MDTREREALRALRFELVPTSMSMWGARLPHIEGFNQNVYDRVFQEISALKPDRVDSPPGLVVHGEHGSGKSHLVWWARQFVAGTGGYYFNIQPDADPDTLWTRTAASMLNDLQRPLGTKPGSPPITQLSLVMGRLARKLSLSARAGNVLAGTEVAEPEEIRRHVASLTDALRQHHRDLAPRTVAAALALLSVCDDDAQAVGRNYLYGEPDDPMARREWGLRLPNPVAAADVVEHLSTVLAMTGPSLFIVDQIDELVVRSTASTEQAGTDEPAGDLAAALMTIRERLTRSITLISCLEHTWQMIRKHSVRSALDRFHTAMELEPIPSPEIGQRLVARFLNDQYDDIGFAPSHPTWPIPPAAFADAKGMRPRWLLQLVEKYVAACLSTGEILPLATLGQPEQSEPTGDTDPVEARYLDHRRTVHVDRVKDTKSDRQLGEILVAALRALVVEHGAEHTHRVDDRSHGAERPTIHAELIGPTGPVLVRGINNPHPRSVGTRVDKAQDMVRTTPDGRLLVVRTSPWGATARILQAVDQVRTGGGRIVELGDNELAVLNAVELTTGDDSEQTRAWLRRQRPVSGTELGRALLGLTGLGTREPTDPPAGSSVEPIPATTTRASAAGSVAEIGSVLDNPNTIPLGRGTSGTVTIRLEELRKHVAVFASSGSGKTVLLRRIIEEAALRGVSTIVLDPNNDLALLGDAWPAPPDGWWDGDPDRSDQYLADTDVVVWTPGRLKGNPLTLQPFPDFGAVRDDPDELRLAVETAVASLAPRARVDGASHVADGRRAILRETLLVFARHGGGDLDDLIALLKDPPEEVLDIPSAGKHADYLASALAYARSNDPLLDGEGTPFDPDRLLTPAPGKRARVSVVNLAAIPDENRPGFVNRLQMTLFSWIKRHPARDRPLSGLFIMDEAQTFIPSGRTTPCTESTRNLASQARKYGLGLVYATQAPRGIDSRIVGNAATHVYGRVTVPAHVNAVHEMARAKGEEPPAISRLTRGRFYTSLEGLPLTEVTAPMCLSHHGSPLEDTEITARAHATRELSQWMLSFDNC